MKTKMVLKSHPGPAVATDRVREGGDKTLITMRSFGYLAFVVFCLLGHTSGFAQPLRIQWEEVNETIDGMPSRYIKLSGKNFQGARYPGGNWIVAEVVPEDASMRFSHQYQTEIFMDFAIFDRLELIKDYTEPVLKEYVFRLRSSYRGKGLKLKDASAVKAADGSVPFMGGTYWKINYSLFEGETENLLRSVIEFVGYDDDNERNYRLRFSVPADLDEKFTKSFVDELGRFSLE